MSVEGEDAGTKIILDFEAWAELSARLLERDHEQRLDLLEERKIDPDEWARCDEHHCRALAGELAAGRLERAQRYGTLCSDELARRRAEPDKPREEPAPPAEALPAAPVAEPAPPPVVQAVATFQMEPPPAAAPPPPEPPSFEGTVDMRNLPSFVKRSVPLPFAPGASAAAVPGAAPAPPAAGAGETLPAAVNLMAHLKASLPFLGASAARPATPAFPELPLQSYASLCAELTVHPERTGETLKKYGVGDDASRRALDEHWRAQAAANPATRDELSRLIATYHDWLLQQRR